MKRAWAMTAALVIGVAPGLAFARDAGPDPSGGDAGAGPDASTAPAESVAPSLPAGRMPELSLSVDPKEAAVGEIINWRLKIKRRTADRVHLSSGASFGGLDVQSKDTVTKELDRDWVEETLEVRLIGFESGEVTIPSQKLTAVDEQGRIAELETDEVAVRIKSLIANEPEPTIKEDTGPGEVVVEKDYTLLWIAGILAGIGIVALLTLAGRRLWAMRRPKPPPPPPPPRPAEEIAYEKLDALKDSNLLEEGRIKEFHVRLSEAMREYFGNRYRFDSLELSTEELTVILRRLPMEPALFDAMVAFLGETDLVKFAKLIPTIDESRDLLKQAYRMVEKTTPVQETEPAASPQTSVSPGPKEADRA